MIEAFEHVLSKVGGCGFSYSLRIASIFDDAGIVVTMIDDAEIGSFLENAFKMFRSDVEAYETGMKDSGFFVVR